MNPANTNILRISQFVVATLMWMITFNAAASETTSVVTIVKPDTVRISNVDDLVLGTFSSLSASLSVSDDVCVYSTSGAYGLIVTSTNGTFALKDIGTSTLIPYLIDWQVSATNSVTYGTPLTGLTGNANNISCDGTTNASFEATVTAADFNAADPGGYSDTITFLIQPE